MSRIIVPIQLEEEQEAFASQQGKALGGTRVSYIRGLINAAMACAKSQARHLPPMDDADAARGSGIVTLKQLCKAAKGGGK